MNYTDIIPRNTPVVCRTYVSGVIVGRLEDGEKGVVVLTEWRHLRNWQNVGNQGSVYDLVQSNVVPQTRGPLMTQKGVFQQADIFIVDEDTYLRLSRG